MARSRNKYSRARMRARVRRPKKRGGARWYYGALACIVIAGFAGIALSTGTSDTPPRAGINPATQDFFDHWHEALGVNICGQWLAAPATFEDVADQPGVRSGLHTHGDGFIHIHPFAAADAGNNATLGRFFHNGGWGLSEDSLDVWVGPEAAPTTTQWTNGDKCPKESKFPGRKGEVKWSVDCVARTGNPADYKLEDLQVVAVAFLPKDKKIGVPPNAFETPVADSSSNPGSQKALNVKTCGTAGPGGTTSTSAGTAVTTTTAPATTSTSVSTTP
jgi:hypothetical protein